MAELIKGEIIKIIKNRLFLLLILMVGVVYFIQVWWACEKLFINELNWLIMYSGSTGYDIMDLIFVEDFTDIVNYSHVISMKSAFLYPMYLYAGNVFTAVVVVAVFSMAGDFSSKMISLEDVYFGKWRYCVGKTLAVTFIAATIFAVLAVGTVVEVLIIRRINISDTVETEVIKALEREISFYNLVGFVYALAVIMLLSFAISFFSIAIGYVSGIPFAGIFAGLLVLLTGNIGPFYLIRDTVSYIYMKVLPYRSMCGFAVASGNYNSPLELLISFYLWLVIFVGIGCLALMVHREPGLR